MRLDRLWLTDFRSYASAELAFVDGVTVIRGANGEGKTNLLEAIAFLATLESFRSAPLDALVRRGATGAVVRAEGVRDARPLLVETEITAAGRTRAFVNRQRLQRTRDLLGALRVSVFSPDDLVLVKGGPAERRRWLDQTLVAERPRLDVVRVELERVLRQRNALLRRLAGTRPDRIAAEDTLTLEVWDAKLVDAGERLAAERAELVERIAPHVAESYARLAARPTNVRLRYVAPWRERGLAASLDAARADELRRGVSLVGPHRDELDIELEGLPARTHASQGEQRTLALALRLAAHEVVTRAAGSPPLLLLDDVFSELDPSRSDALLAHLPRGQVVMTTAGALPEGAHPDRTFWVRDGTVALAGACR